MAREELFASFILDTSLGLEIALRAEIVAEATAVSGVIQQLPASVDFVEGIMHLRSEVIPLINMKKRLGFANYSYNANAKVAVVKHSHRRYGLLFDDIKEVFSVGAEDIETVDRALQTEDRIISSLIKRDPGVRTVELLDLAYLFNGDAMEEVGEVVEISEKNQGEKNYSCYVIFSFAEQLYGVPVENAQEITFFEAVNQMYRGGVEEKHPPYSSAIHDIFKHGDIDGILTLRGRIIPVLNSRRLLNGSCLVDDEYLGENTRILVLVHDGFAVGMIVEEIKAIESIADEDILSMGVNNQGAVAGIYSAPEKGNIMLLNLENLIHDRTAELKSLSRLSSEAVEEAEIAMQLISSHHLITENCYLIFKIGKHMAVQLKDVQEIIERDGIMGIPRETGYSSGVINLRGLVVPVVSLRRFYGYGDGCPVAAQQKLIICRTGDQTVALEVDNIVTIYKQEKYQNTGVLNPDLAEREDTLDRLIVFDNGEAKKEHVLVVNIHNLVRNHLGMAVA